MIDNKHLAFKGTLSKYILGLSIITLASCSDSSDTNTSDTSCNRPADPGIHFVSLEQDGTDRPFAVYVPPSYTGKDAPLVLLLHGSFSTGVLILDTADSEGNKIFQADADKNGYLIAAPTGTVPLGPRFAWNIPGVPLVGVGVYPPDQSLDDTAYINLAISASSEEFCVDQSRVYATGFSGGGRMSSQLGCELSERIAAIAPIGGVRAPSAADTPPRTVECAPTRAMPVLALHGTADTTNEFANDDPGILAESSWTYGVPEAMSRWALLNSCLVTDPLVEKFAPQVELVKYQSCNADTWLYKYEGLEHVIPGTSSGSEPAAPALMWAFFEKHRL